MESCLAKLLNGRGQVRRWGGGLVKACRTIPLSLGAILGQVFDLWINDKSHNFATIFNCNSSFLLCCFFVCRGCLRDDADCFIWPNYAYAEHILSHLPISCGTTPAACNNNINSNSNKNNNNNSRINANKKKRN